MRIAIPHGGRESPLGRRIARVWGNMDSTPRAPHLSTVQWEIYVPEGELLYIEYMYTRVMRYYSAAMCGNAESSIVFLTLDENEILLAQATLHSNVEYDFKEYALAPGIVLEPGEHIECRTRDNSVGGAVCYWGELLGFRFTP